MSTENEDGASTRVVPDQTEKEEAETHESAPVEKFSRGRGN